MVKLLVPRAGHIVATIRQAYRRATNGVGRLTVVLDSTRFVTDIVPMTEADFSNVYEAVCAYIGVAPSPAVLEVATFLTTLQSNELDFRLIRHMDHSGVRALACALRYHLTFDSIIFDDTVAADVFDSIRHNDVIHTLNATDLWPSSVMDLAACLTANPNNTVQVRVRLIETEFDFMCYCVGVCIVLVCVYCVGVVLCAASGLMCDRFCYIGIRF